LENPERADVVAAFALRTAIQGATNTGAGEYSGAIFKFLEQFLLNAYPTAVVVCW